MLVPFSVARVGGPELGDGGVRRAPGHAHGQAAKAPAENGSALRTRCGAGERGGPVAWQPPHMQDEDLVPRMAGGLPRPTVISHRSSTQTLGPESILRPQNGSSPEGNLRAW